MWELWPAHLLEMHAPRGQVIRQIKVTYQALFWVLIDLIMDLDLSIK
jgi:hypothetical protein